MKVRAALPIPRPFVVILGVAIVWTACGRSELDFSGGDGEFAGRRGGAAGTSGAGGSFATAGTFGLAGTFGAAGTSGLAGSFGFAGTIGSAGTFGFAGSFGSAGSFGAGGTFGVAGSFGVPDAGTDAPSPICMPGATTCSGTSEVLICTADGSWGAFFPCPKACAQGVCTECLPGETDCTLPGLVRVCDVNGIWLPPRPAGVECGAVCKPGETRCASVREVQTCTPQGQWSAPTKCARRCGANSCDATPRLVFVTSRLFQGGALGGLAGADSYCQKLAATAGLPGTYLAWLSAPEGTAAERFTREGGPYVLVDGTIVASGWAELTTSGVRNPINLTEVFGPALATNTICTSHAVWTNTASDGTLAQRTFDCEGWKDPMWFRAAFGNAAAIATWTDGCRIEGGPSNTCQAEAALYCFQQ